MKETGSELSMVEHLLVSGIAMCGALSGLALNNYYFEKADVECVPAVAPAECKGIAIRDEHLGTLAGDAAMVLGVSSLVGVITARRRAKLL